MSGFPGSSLEKDYLLYHLLRILKVGDIYDLFYSMVIRSTFGAFAFNMVNVCNFLKGGDEYEFS